MHCARLCTPPIDCCLLCSPRLPIGMPPISTDSKAGVSTQLSRLSADAAACWWGMGAGVGGPRAGKWGLQELIMSNACFAVGRSAGSVAKHMSISCSISAGHSSGTCAHHGLLSAFWFSQSKQLNAPIYSAASSVNTVSSRGQADAITRTEHVPRFAMKIWPHKSAKRHLRHTYVTNGVVAVHQWHACSMQGTVLALMARKRPLLGTSLVMSSHRITPKLYISTCRPPGSETGRCSQKPYFSCSLTDCLLLCLVMSALLLGSQV